MRIYRLGETEKTNTEVVRELYDSFAEGDFEDGKIVQ